MFISSQKIESLSLQQLTSIHANVQSRQFYINTYIQKRYADQTSFLVHKKEVYRISISLDQSIAAKLCKTI